MELVSLSIHISCVIMLFLLCGNHFFCNLNFLLGINLFYAFNLRENIFRRSSISQFFCNH